MEKFFPLVSIVIPVYNGTNYLGEAIDSALTQTYKNIEIIVVNDGSCDDGGTEKIALSYGPKIRYFSKVNGGTSSALNVGIKNMRGQYFCWLSHDDLYTPDCVKAQIDLLSQLENKKTITMTDLNTMDQDYNIVHPDTNYQCRADIWPKRVESLIYPVIYMRLHGCQLMFHREIFDDVGLFDEKMLVAQDFEFFSRAFSRNPHKLISKVLGTSRDSSNRQGRRSVNLGSKEYSEVFLKIINSLSENDISNLAPTKLDFLLDMQDIYRANGYEDAYKEITNRLFNHVHVNYSDLPGRAFNGYEQHLTARQRGLNASQIVWEKHSNTNSVLGIANVLKNREIYKEIEEIEVTFGGRAVFSPFMYDLVNSQTFLDAQLVHLHIMHHPAFNITLLPILSMLKPTVWTLHDPWILSGHCVHSGECEKWKTHCNDCEFKNLMFSIEHDNTALQFEIKRQAIQNSNIHFIVGSSWMENKLRQSPMFENKKISLIPFGVDQKVFFPGIPESIYDNLGIADVDFILLARTDKQFKGVSYINDAINFIAEKYNVALITVGEKGLIRQLGNKFKLVELGWVSDPQKMVNLYRACDLLLMPSELESFGMMAVEAMSCGKMVLAIDIPSSALCQTIDSPNCGLAVPPLEYSKTLLALLDSPTDIKERGDRSLALARTKYDYETYVSQSLELYKEVVSGFTASKASSLILEQLTKHSSSYRRGALRDGNVAYKNGIGTNNNVDSQGINTTLKLAFIYYKRYGLKAAMMKTSIEIKRILGFNNTKDPLALNGILKLANGYYKKYGLKATALKSAAEIKRRLGL